MFWGLAVMTCVAVIPFRGCDGCDLVAGFYAVVVVRGRCSFVSWTIGSVFFPIFLRPSHRPVSAVRCPLEYNTVATVPSGLHPGSSFGRAPDKRFV